MDALLSVEIKKNEKNLLFHLAENDVATIKVRSRRGRDEELWAICVLAAVRHWEKEGAVVLHRSEVLVLKGATVDGLPTRAVAIDKVSTLRHESLDDSVNKTNG